MRCRSYTDIDWRELFAPAGASGRTFESFVRSDGRAEAIWYPFTDKPWMKVWSIAPEKPAASREVTGPYNYPFSDNVPEPITDLLGQITAGNTSIAPAFGQTYYGVTVAGLAATNSSDIWGWSKDLQFYIKATTLRLTEGGGAVLTSRANIANVIHDFTHWFHERIEHYRSLGQYPLNGPVEIRCCGLDQPGDVRVPSAGPPTISAMRPRPPDHPEWDTAIWLNVLGVPGTPGMFAFYREMEQWMRQRFAGGDSTFRPEWSKGWAFGPPDLPYTDDSISPARFPTPTGRVSRRTRTGIRPGRCSTVSIRIGCSATASWTVCCPEHTVGHPDRVKFPETTPRRRTRRAKWRSGWGAFPTGR